MDKPILQIFVNLQRHSVFVEFLGNSVGYSCSYDLIFLAKNKFKTSARVGLGYMPTIIGSEHHIILPLETSALWGKKNHYFEFGLGATFIYQLYEGVENGIFGQEKVERGTLTYGVVRLGYRYQKEGGGLFFKIGLTPIFEVFDTRKSDDQKIIIPYLAGIGVGYTIPKKFFTSKL